MSAGEQVLRTASDVLRALAELAGAGEAFTVHGVRYVPEARLLELCDEADVVARLRAELTRTADRGGCLPTDVIRAELAR